MCVILALNPNQMMSFNRIKNATLNNPDGYGLVLKDRGKFEVIRRLHADGNDPEEVYELLDDNKEYERILHLRYGTVGGITDDNVHPFKVFEDKGANLETLFMHNGTLQNFKEANSEISDSRKFASEIVAPLLERWHNENGRADIEDPFLKVILSQYFGGTINRGILISNRYKPLLLGQWTTAKDDFVKDKTEDILVSNNDYFTAAQNARVRENRKESFATKNPPSKDAPWPDQTQIAHRTSQTASGSDSGENSNTPEVIRIGGRKLVPLKEVNLAQTGRFLKASDLRNVIPSLGEDLADEDLQYLEMVTEEEWFSFAQLSPAEVAMLLTFLSAKFARTVVRANASEEKHLKATNVIATMAFELNQLKNSSTPKEDQ